MSTTCTGIFGYRGDKEGDFDTPKVTSRSAAVTREAGCAANAAGTKNPQKFNVKRSTQTQSEPDSSEPHLCQLHCSHKKVYTTARITHAQEDLKDMQAALPGTSPPNEARVYDDSTGS